VVIANLQMYAWPEMSGAYDRYWGLVRDRLRQAYVPAPDALSFFEDESSPWSRDDLLLGQTCGFPYRHELHNKVQLVGTPDYGVPGCSPGYYRSVFVARRPDGAADPADFASARFVCNHRGSQSGYVAPLVYASDHGFTFSQILESSSHRSSARMVAEGTADIACIDAVSWRFMERYDAFTGELAVIAETAASPGLPYITALSNDRELLFDAVAGAINELGSDDRQALGLCGIVYIPPEDYLAVRDPDDMDAKSDS
jgi:ABC-type phosphate/phosphonate transport system substrate-binding protein